MRVRFAPCQAIGVRVIANGGGSGYGDDPEQLAPAIDSPDSLPGKQGTCGILNEMYPAMLPQEMWGKA